MVAARLAETEVAVTFSRTHERLAMVAIISLLVVLVVSLLIVRIATVALALTGLSHPLARFQARSAFTGAGFTTSESEKVVQHPVRRRIIMLLMLLGNAGIVTAVSSLILTFVGTGEGRGITGTLWFRVLVLAVGLAALWSIAHSEWIDQRMSKMIASALKRWTDLEIRDYAGLLHLSGDYAVVEMQVEPHNWMADHELTQLKLPDEGVLVLGIEKPGGVYLGAPRGKTKLMAGDTVIMYGPRDVLADLDQRWAGSRGNWEHHKAVDGQLKVEKRELEIQERSEASDATRPNEHRDTLA